MLSKSALEIIRDNPELLIEINEEYYSNRNKCVPFPDFIKQHSVESFKDELGNNIEKGEQFFEVTEDNIEDCKLYDIKHANAHQNNGRKFFLHKLDAEMYLARNSKMFSMEDIKLELKIHSVNNEDISTILVRLTAQALKQINK